LSSQFGTKIAIENLKYDVLESDLKDLMGNVGTVEQVKIFYDNSGRSEGKAEVVFKKREDAERAVKEYDGAAIDDQTMFVTMKGRTRVSSKGWRISDSNISDRLVERRQNRNSTPRNNNNQNNNQAMIIDEDLSNLKIRVSF